ncbi:MAG: thioredoxin [Gemmatimonadales bacterium]
MTSNSPGKATVRCSFCSTLNKVDLKRAEDGPKCGNCGRPIRMDRPMPITDAEFEKVVAGTDVPVVVDFYADWCGPCKMMAPALDEFAHGQVGKVLVLKLDTDANQATAQRFGIKGIPTLIAFENGSEARRHVGMADANILSTLAGVSGSGTAG